VMHWFYGSIHNVTVFIYIALCCFAAFAMFAAFAAAVHDTALL
jgi:hypothetical protein